MAGTHCSHPGRTFGLQPGESRGAPLPGPLATLGKVGSRPPGAERYLSRKARSDMAACAAASRATGMRNGEQET